MGLETIDNTDTTTSRYLHLLETWNEQNRGSIEEGISSAFVESLPKGAKSIKWLSIGPGLGDREAPILATLRRERPEVKVELFEVYESNPHLCSVLRSKIQASRKAQDGVWSSIGEIVINESDFTVEKDAGGKGGHWYDVINLFHLTYYFVTPAERAELFRRLHSLLAPGGAVHFLNVAERTGEELNPQFLMYKELGGIMTAAGIATKSRVDWNTADVLWREYAAVADGFGMTRRMKTLPYKRKLGPKANGGLCLDLLTFVFGFEVTELPADTIARMAQWIERNTTAEEEEEKGGGEQLFISGADAILTYVNP